MPKKILITGGAGFVGSSLAIAFKNENPSWNVVAFDNLRRRGSELNLDTFRKLGIDFVHGDIRNLPDLEDLNGHYDLLIEASAEPSVLAGINSAPSYLLQTNLAGTLNCLEFARRRAPAMVFLSTSRVYSIAPLRQLNFDETATRFELSKTQELSGIGPEGVSEDFPRHLPRSLYGASKLASEMVVQEYAATYGMKAVINRCGVIAGPGQFGKVDQGVFTMWVANHYFKQKLGYTGFGGTGKQVRDLLHPADLYSIVKKQWERMDSFDGEIFNVGGGNSVSVSLKELTAICQDITGNSVSLASKPESNAVDIPWYISDCTKARKALDWKAERSVLTIVRDIFEWIRTNEDRLKPLFT